jgi:ribose transport system substrate-binding protein
LEIDDVGTRGSKPWARLALAAIAVIALAVALAACGGGGSSSSGSTSEAPSTSEESTEEATTEEGGGGSELEAAEEATEAAFEGRFGTPPSEPNKATSGKNVWVISPGQASAPAAALSNAAIAAGKLLGWHTTLCDAKLDPAKQAECYKSAIAGGAEGILGVATDCPNIKGQIQEATAANVDVVPIFSFDCDEVGQGAAQYSAQISFGERYKTAREYFEASGEDGAAWIVDTTKGEANLLSLENPEYYDLKFWQAGFSKGMEKYCSSCAVESEEFLLASEAGTPFQEKVATGLTKNPEINAIQMGWNVELGPGAAVEQSGRGSELSTIGGLGVESDIAAIRETDSLKACIGQPLGWWGFAGADTLNSLFNGEEPRDEGIGWQLLTKEQNLPTKNEVFKGPVEYEAAYKKSWGV